MILEGNFEGSQKKEYTFKLIDFLHCIKHSYLKFNTKIRLHIILKIIMKMPED